MYVCLPVQVGAGGGEAGYVLSEPVVRALQPAVQVGHPVEGLAGHVPLVRHPHQPAAEGEGKLWLEEADEGVYESGWERSQCNTVQYCIVSV